MNVVNVWNDTLVDTQKQPLPIFALAWKPDGSQLVASAGSHVLVYAATKGDLLATLKGHKGTVFCVDYARDGTRFATGGLDKMVIIWNNKLEGILKYSHSDSIQALKFNSITNQLISCSTVDFGFWSEDVSTVPKYKVTSSFKKGFSSYSYLFLEL